MQTYIEYLPREISIEAIEKSLDEGSNYEKFVKAVKLYVKKNKKSFKKHI